MAKVVLVILALLSAFSGPVWADGSVPASGEKRWRWQRPGFGETEYKFGSAQAACDDFATALSNTYNGSYTGSLGGDPNDQNRSCTAGGLAASVSYSIQLFCDGQPTTSQTCPCPSGTKPDASGASCVKDCQFGKKLSEGYYDIGTNPQANPLMAQCINSCWASFDGYSPVASSMENNTKHWYAQGAYYATGAACTMPANPTPYEGLPSVPQDSCDSSKYDKGTVNGKMICTLKGTDTPAPPKPSASSSSSTDSSTTKNADGSTTKTDTTTTKNADGSSSSTTTVTTTKPDGSTSSTTTTTVTPNPAQPDDAEKSACEKNPSGAGCGGSAAGVSSSWSSRTGGKTFTTVFAKFKDSVTSSPIASSVKGFFTINASGSCPRWAVHVDWIGANFSLDFFCSEAAARVYAMVRVVLLLVASWFAFRVAFDY